ncbi:MAG: glycoside hydrolase family 97 catalytic domain-containing protein [Niastella sp.]|nr:glycoside hydrolase family 97 catalytic domain-containing protein [Niastella sp.]
MRTNTIRTTILFLITCAVTSQAQQTTLESPNRKIIVDLVNEHAAKAGAWHLTIKYQTDGKVTEAVPRIDLGLVRNDQDFSGNLVLLKTGKPVLINEQYTALHGKQLNRANTANELTAYFETPGKAKMNVIIRAWNDGVTFRYEFPEKQGSFIIKDERTTFSIPQQTMRWMEKWNPANEGLYTAMSDEKIQQQDWCYPALFNTPGKACWFLLHEADVNRDYCGTKLRNTADKNAYKLTFPNPKDGAGQGDSLPSIKLPWKSPWRVIIAGSLTDIVASTLVEDASAPSVIKNTDWIRPGAVSWNYWSNNHGTKDYKIVTTFADLAARMNWPYTLLDWEWDAMGNGGTLEDAAKYILSKGVRPLIWYNSGGKHTYVPATPRDRMLTHESRVAEFTKLKKLGFAGVKVDFFESEKQDMIRYYLDILEDAASFEMMVYFHGCMVPRGWARTYPNMMTNEAVRGAEWYNNGPEFTNTAPEHNCILPFTRNVVGAMDYTPVTFTNSQFPHLTSYGHELALSVIFESALQHFADRPEGYDALPDAAKSFLKTVPVIWEQTQFVDGYPGKEVIMARRKGNDWYMAGINGEIRPKKKKITFGFLKQGVKYKMTLMADGQHDKAFDIQQHVVDQSTTIEVQLLRRGGFAASLVPLQ